MREILFRGKRVDNGEWVYGNLNYGTIEIKSIKDSYYISDFDVNPWDKKFYLVIPESVGQYTGLTDKNGKKIFEGDILSIAQMSNGLGDYYYPPIKYPVNVIVRWDLCAWMWQTIEEQKFYLTFPDAWCHYESEVIGNIHDNPELLEVTE